MRLLAWHCSSLQELILFPWAIFPPVIGGHIIQLLDGLPVFLDFLVPLATKVVGMAAPTTGLVHFQSPKDIEENVQIKQGKNEPRKENFHGLIQKKVEQEIECQRTGKGQDGTGQEEATRFPQMMERKVFQGLS
jgi:hypothetical protein